MASLVWTSVYLLLLVELAIVTILVIPIPRRLRNILAKFIQQFNLGARLAKPVLFIGVALAFALVESYYHHQRIVDRLDLEKREHGGMSREHEHTWHVHDKERKYKAERNMYLAGFALTLIFVIGRITQLMQESVELEEKINERQRKEEPSKPKSQTEKKND
jgi:signal transduction histidine kinase